MSEPQNKITKVKKKDFRPRAHVAPFSYFDMHIDLKENIDFLDIGCGYGKFLFYLSKFDKKNSLGIEIRDKVKEFVNLKIKEMNLKNVEVIKSNCLLFLPNIFPKNSLEKIFILYPDPLFKKKDRKARIVSFQMLFMYFYLLKENGKIYISTDVEEYFEEILNLFKDDKFSKEIEYRYKFSDNEWINIQKEGVGDEIGNEFVLGTDEARRAGIKNQKAFGVVYKRK